MGLRFKLKTSFSPRALFLLLIPFQTPMAPDVEHHHFPEPSSCGVFSTAYLSYLALSTSLASSLICEKKDTLCSDSIATPQQVFSAWEQRKASEGDLVPGQLEKGLFAGWYKLPGLLGLKCNRQSPWVKFYDPQRKSSICMDLWL